MKRNELLSQLLDCKIEDLKVIDNVTIEVHDILNEIAECGEKFILDNIMLCAMSIAKDYIKLDVNTQLKNEYVDGNKYDSLMLLKPEKDIKIHCCNGVCGAKIENNVEIYDKYLNSRVIFKALTGIELK